MAKQYCTCIAPKAFRPLWDSTLQEWSDIFICNQCQKPSKGIWENHLGTCENCMKSFSFPETLYSPWGPVSVLASPGDDLYTCRACSPIVGHPEPYRGWKWAARQKPEWHPGYLPSESVAETGTFDKKPLDNLVATL